MRIIECPPCKGSGKDSTTLLRCSACKGEKKVSAMLPDEAKELYANRRDGITKGPIGVKHQNGLWVFVTTDLPADQGEGPKDEVQPS